MAYTVESLETGIPSVQPIAPMAQPRTFTGYDPNGTTTITGSPKVEQAPQAEPTIEGKTETSESLTLSPKISAIARKEQAQRRREFEFKQREKALEEKLADAAKYNELKTKLAAKDFSAAEAAGLSYDEYAKYKVDELEKKDPIKEEQMTLKSEIEALKKSQEEQTIKEYNANQALWRQEIKRVVSENEDFSSIKELGMEEAVLRHINDSFDEDGIELSAEEAAKEIEAELVKRAEKFSSLPKIKGKTEAKVLGPPKVKTITQNMTPSSETKKSSKPFHMMSEMEQWEEARRRVEAQRLQYQGR